MFISLGIYALSYQLLSPRHTMLMQAPAFGLYGAALLELGYLGGALVCFLGVIRDLATYFSAMRNLIWTLSIFVFFVWLSVISTSPQLGDIFPAIATSVVSLSLVFRDEFYKFRIIMLVGLLFWLCHGFLIKSPSTIFWMAVMILSNIMGIVRYRLARKRFQQS